MNVPKTYEEFLKTPKEELLKITDEVLDDDDFTRMISFCKKAREDRKNKMNKIDFKKKVLEYKKHKVETKEKSTKCGMNCSENNFNKMYKDFKKDELHSINRKTCKKCKYADLKKLICKHPKYTHEVEGFIVMKMILENEAMCDGKDFERKQK